MVRLPSWFKSAAAVELPREPISLDCRIMSPFLSFLRTISVAHVFSRAFADSFAVDEVVVADELFELLLAGLLELEGVVLVDELLDRSSLRLSSLRRSSPRRSSSRERLPRESPRPRSLYRLRQLRPSRLSPSDRELRPESWARTVWDVMARALHENASVSSKYRWHLIIVSTDRAGRSFAVTLCCAYCCHCNRNRRPLCGSIEKHENRY
jgi:hypothetical protein